MPGIRTAAFTVLLTGAAFGQAQAPRPAFEAASVKLNTTGDRGSHSDGSRGQVVMSNQTLRRVIERAYSVRPYQVIGPGWLDEVRVDIAAKYPPDSTPENRPLMLRTLLEDRFKLAAHRETRELPGYALVAAKGGFKLKPVEPGDDDIDHHGNVLQARKVSMAMLAEHLGRIVGETIADGSGIAGVYDVDLRWTIDDQNAAGDKQEILIAAFQEALSTVGLRLHPQKVPVQVVVVDHLERAPTEN